MSQDTPPHGTGEGFSMLVAERLARIETLLEGIRRDRDEENKQREDHENRLRALERWRYMLPSSLIAALVSAGVTLYGQLGR